MSEPSENKSLLKAAAEVLAIEEARREEQVFGPRYYAKCPDCGAIVNVRTLENGRHELEFVKHAS